MMLAQDGKCAICGKQLTRFHIDHNHETGKVRGLLCHRCNISLPFIEDGVFREAAAKYLRDHQ